MLKRRSDCNSNPTAMMDYHQLSTNRYLKTEQRPKTLLLMRHRSYLLPTFPQVLGCYLLPIFPRELSSNLTCNLLQSCSVRVLLVNACCSWILIRATSSPDAWLNNSSVCRWLSWTAAASVRSQTYSYALFYAGFKWPSCKTELLAQSCSVMIVPVERVPICATLPRPGLPGSTLYAIALLWHKGLICSLE